MKFRTSFLLSNCVPGILGVDQDLHGIRPVDGGHLQRQPPGQVPPNASEANAAADEEDGAQHLPLELLSGALVEGGSIDWA